MFMFSLLKGGCCDEDHPHYHPLRGFEMTKKYLYVPFFVMFICGTTSHPRHVPDAKALWESRSLFKTYIHPVSQRPLK